MAYQLRTSADFASLSFYDLGVQVFARDCSSKRDACLACCFRLTPFLDLQHVIFDTICEAIRISLWDLRN